MQLYDYFRHTEAGWSNILRDAELAPLVKEMAEERRLAYLREVFAGGAVISRRGGGVTGPDGYGTVEVGAIEAGRGPVQRAATPATGVVVFLRGRGTVRDALGLGVAVVGA